MNDKHTPRKKRTQVTRKKNTLLIDIEAKLQAGKGGGYERWAKVFNVKQMAQTYNYLREHGLLDYAELEEKASAATEQFHALSAQIKAAKNAFDELGVKKLPTVKSLQEEYAKLLTEKKTAYADFVVNHKGRLILSINPGSLLTKEEWQEVDKVLKSKSEESNEE